MTPSLTPPFFSSSHSSLKGSTESLWGETLVEGEKNGGEEWGWRRRLTRIMLTPGPLPSTPSKPSLRWCHPSAPQPLGQLLPAHWIESEQVLVAFKAPAPSLPLGSPHSPTPQSLASFLSESASILGPSPGSFTQAPYVGSFLCP